MSWDVVGTVSIAPGLIVRRVGFGGAWLTGPGTYGPLPDLDKARRVVRRAVDPDVPVEESLGALVALRDTGKIRVIGLCDVTVAELDVARAVTPISSVQDRYDLLTRENDDVLDACRRDGLVFLPWFPPVDDVRATEGSVLARVASAHRASPAQVALAWLVRRAPTVVPLPGTATPERWEQDLAALDLRLTDGEVEGLTAVEAPAGRPEREAETGVRRRPPGS